jgi:hypothetical protein
MILLIKEYSIMTSKNNYIFKKKQEINAKENEIVDTLTNTSEKVKAESKEESKQIGDSDHE